MPVERCVQPELLDKLPPGDARARRSRADLRVLNACMGNATIMADRLRKLCSSEPPARVADLGGGDGTVLLRVAHLLRWKGVSAVLVDRHELVSSQTIVAFQELGWALRPIRADVFEWLSQPEPPGGLLIVANLFLHHFMETQLVQLLSLVGCRGAPFVAVEPHRSWTALLASRLLWLLGCNAVTRHDAVLSVRAGFARADLSGLWPSGSWILEERPAGLFSYVFSAVPKHQQPDHPI